jgi:hypothetical protein
MHRQISSLWSCLFRTHHCTSPLADAMNRAAAICGGLLAVSAAEPVPLIIDADMSADADDVVALRAAHAMMDRGEANILATIHDASYASASEWHRYEDCGHRLRLAYFHGVFTISHQNLLPGFHVYFAIHEDLRESALVVADFHICCSFCLM